MIFNWDGDLILQNTVIEQKRYVIGSKKQIKTDIREWISFEDNNIMKEILQGLSEKKGLPSSKKPGDFDKRAMIIWDFVAKNLKYVHDEEKQNKEDFWLFPPEIYTLREGDCEDGSFLLASLLIASGISPFCVRVALGEVFDEKGKSLGGHCWPVYKNESGQWCILESTLDNIPSRFPEADKLTTRGQYFQYVPEYCFNNYHLWEILPADDGKAVRLDIEKYLRGRKKKVHMRKTRFPSGGWISRLTGDWEPGHLEITEAVLKDIGFSSDAINIVGDASQDPDFYDWYTPGAHAQTENDGNGKTIGETKAIDNYLNWIKEYHTKLIEKAGKDLRHALFFLGYILHGIEDLAAHKGITNAQHSYLTNTLGKAHDPDHNPASRDMAKEYCRQYMEHLMIKDKYGNLFEKLKKYKGVWWSFDRLTPEEKAGLLNKRGWDFSPIAYVEYANLADKYKKIKDDDSIEEWNTDDVFKQLVNCL